MTKDPIVAAFDARAAREPGTTLVVSRGQSASNEAIAALARGVASRLAGSGPEVAIAVRCPNGPGFLAAILACRRVGAAVVLLDRASSDAEAARIAARLGAHRMLSSSVAWPESPDAFTVAPVSSGTGAWTPHLGVVYVKTTSGTAGEPKGIGVGADHLLADDAAIRSTMDVRPSDLLLATVPFSHSYGLSSLVVPALAHGIRLLVPGPGGAFEPLLRAAELGATVFPTVPAYLSAWTRVSSPPPLPASLRTVLSAGAPLPPEVAARFRERFGRGVHVFYGASECGGITYDRDGTAGERGTLGTPLDGVRVRIESDGTRDDGAPTDTGRVVVESDAVATTYLPEPRADLCDGRFLSADLGGWRDGELVLTGRIDRWINVKGRKVDPREVERLIADLDGVVDVYVDGVRRDASGDELVRAVVACPHAHPSTDEIRAWCRDHLSESKTPRTIVRVRELPRNDRGKIDAAALRALLSDGVSA